MKNKKFEAVQFMREIRDKMSRKYMADPRAERSDLEAIRIKYGITGRTGKDKWMAM